MCNRYACDIAKAPAWLRKLHGFDDEEWSETRINPVLEIFPDQYAPIVRRREGGGVEWVRMRWGLPGPAQVAGPPVTNVRNLDSPHWRALLGPANRCLIPFTRFAEYDDASPKGAKVARWFARPGEPLAMFAGLWRPWTGVRGPKRAPVEGEHLLFALITTEANEVVRPIHAQAMPLLLTNGDEYKQWLSAPASEIRDIQQRPVPPEALALLEENEDPTAPAA